MRRTNGFLLLFLTVFVVACEPEYTPKPKGYMRVTLPEKDYKTYQGNCPYTFEYPVRSLLENKTRGVQRPCWYNLHYPQFAATVHLSYFAIEKDELYNYAEESRGLAMKHIVKANQIKETNIQNPKRKVFGTTYDFSGETASNYQFFLTDSTEHFFRGAMYFNLPPNPDSLQPITNYIKQDIVHLIETFSWKED